jgi:hypothetical protein
MAGAKIPAILNQQKPIKTYNNGNKNKNSLPG